MIQTLSTLFDSQHFLHPKHLKEKSEHDQPTLFRRILGAALVALSIPFTLGIATGFFTYWAHRKVVHIEKQDRADIELRVEKAYGKVYGESPDTEIPAEIGTFEAALKALYKGDKKTLMAKVEELKPEEMTKDAKNSLIAAAIAYDRFDELDALWDKFESVYLPLHEAKSPEMVAKIADQVKDQSEYINKLYDGGNTALHHQQNLAVVKALTERGAKHEGNKEGKTPLHLCTDPKIAEHLIDHFGAAILEACDREGRTPLFTVPAAVKRVLIKKGADVKALDNNGKTVLHYFSEDSFKQDPNLIHTVLRKVDRAERKDFVNTEDKNGAVALTEKLPLNVIKALVKAGAEFPVEGKKSPLHQCEDPEVAKYLIGKFGKGILIQKDANGKIPLIVNKFPDVLRVFIQEMEDITFADYDDEKDTIFAWFSAEPLKSHPDLIDDVLARFSKPEELKAFVNQGNSNGRVPLSYNLPAEAVKALVEAGAEYPAEGGNSPLNNCDNPELAKYLIGKFGNEILMQKDSNGNIPLLVNNNPEVLRVMIQEMEDITVALNDQGSTILHWFSAEPLKSHPELIHDVLAKIENEDERRDFVNKAKEKGVTPLMYTVPLEVVKALVEAGAEYFVEGKQTNLHVCEDPAIAEYLMERFGTEADHLERTDQSGRTPLMRNTNPDVVQLLLDNGAKVDAANVHSGRQPLFYAKTVEVAEKLVAAGADPNAKANGGKSVLFGFISPAVAQWLINEKGINPQEKDDAGNEPIHQLENKDDDVELAKVLYGNRGKNFDWQGKVPPIMENAKFKEWLATLS